MHYQKSVGGFCKKASFGLSGYHHSLLLSLDKHMPKGLIRHLILYLDLSLVFSLSLYASTSWIPQVLAPLYKEKGKQEGGSGEVTDELIWGLPTYQEEGT